MKKHSVRFVDFFAHFDFFLLPFSSLTLPTSALPSVHIVGNLASKLPSAKVSDAKERRETQLMYVM